MRDLELTDAAIQSIHQLAVMAETVDEMEIGGRKFTDREIHRVNLDPDLPKALPFYGLAGLVGYLKADSAAAGALVHVVSPTKVEAVGVLEGDDKHLRRVFAVAESQLGAASGFAFNNAASVEQLNIALLTCFEPSKGDIAKLREFCASVRDTSELGLADDGVSQSVSAKSGVAAVLATAVRNPWQLAPFRTFAEVDQPLSPYVLRFFKSSEGPKAGLFETGNAQWKPAAVAAIATWLRSALGPEWKVLG